MTERVGGDRGTIVGNDAVYLYFYTTRTVDIDHLAYTAPTPSYTHTPWIWNDQCVYIHHVASYSGTFKTSYKTHRCESSDISAPTSLPPHTSST